MEEVEETTPVVAEVDIDDIDVDDYEDDDEEEIPVIHLLQVPTNTHQDGQTQDEETARIQELLVQDAVVDLEANVQQESRYHQQQDLFRNASTNEMPQAAPVLIPSSAHDDDDDDDMDIMSVTTSGNDGTNERGEFISIVLAPQKLPKKHKKHISSDKNNSSSDSIGLILLQDEAGKVSRITENSILSHSPLQSGDELVSLNGQSCQEIPTSFEIAELVLVKTSYHYGRKGGRKRRSPRQLLRHHRNDKDDDANKYVHMVFRNPVGDSNRGLVHCMLMKEKPTDKLGIKVGNFPNGEIQITEILPHSIAGQSFLNVGDIILQVNDVACHGGGNVSSQEVAVLLQSAPEYVNVTVRAGSNRAVVVAEVDHRDGNDEQEVNTTGVPDLDQPVMMANRYGRRGGFLVGMVKMCFPIMIIAVTVAFLSSRESLSEDNCDFTWIEATDLSFPFSNTIQTSDHLTDIMLFNNTNSSSSNTSQSLADVDDWSDDLWTLFISVRGRFDMYSRRRIREPTSDDVNRLLENTTVFFSNVLEEDSVTGDTYRSSRLLLNAWSYSACSGLHWRDFDLYVTLEANFTQTENSTILENHVREALKETSGGAFRGTYLDKYVRTIGNESCFESTFFIRWNF